MHLTTHPRHTSWYIFLIREIHPFITMFGITEDGRIGVVFGHELVEFRVAGLDVGHEQ